MRILITGMAGFIGSNVFNDLVQKYPQYYFVGVDKMSYCSSIKHLSELDGLENYLFIKGDITNLDFMDFIFRTHRIDTVMHFAAYTHVDHSFGNSIIFTTNNVMGTHVLLEVSKKNNIKRFIHVSTDEVYGNNHGESNEETLLNPTNPYAATKAAAEHLVRSYWHSFGLPIIISRGNNVYGPMQYPEKVIPRFILNLLEDKPCEIHGTGEQVRSFMYIDDVVEAFDVLLHKGEIGETYNIGCEEEQSILSLAKMLMRYFEKDEEEYIKFVEDRDFNDQRYFISSRKLQELGWNPKTSFKEGLENTILWYTINPTYWE